MILDVNDEEAVFKEQNKTSDGLVLKELPKGLKYAFWGRMVQSL